MKTFSYKQEILLQITVFLFIIGLFAGAVWAIETGVIKTTPYDPGPQEIYIIEYIEYPSYQHKTTTVTTYGGPPSQVQVNPNLPDNGIRTWDENGHRQILYNHKVFSIESIKKKK